MGDPRELTVAVLIARLQQLDPLMPVYFTEGAFNYPVQQVAVEDEVVRNPTSLGVTRTGRKIAIIGG